VQRGGFVGVGVDEVGAVVGCVVGEVGGVAAVGWPVLVLAGTARAFAEPVLYSVEDHRGMRQNSEHTLSPTCNSS